VAFGFYLIRSLEAWEQRHPIDVQNPTRWQLWVRRIALPLVPLTMLAIFGGIVAVSFETISFGLWVGIVVGLPVACAILYVLYLRMGRSAP
jgi:hypothetical protein